MTDCDVGCSGLKPEDVPAAKEKDRVEYKQAEDVMVDNKEEIKEEIKEDIPILVQLLGAQLISENGIVATRKLIEKEVIGLFFSADWCEPCQTFMQTLPKAYTKLTKEDNQSFEIVFISSDENEDGFQKCLKTMPWLALPFADRFKKGKLSRMYGVNGIPSLVMIDPKTGQAINPDAKRKILDDKTWENFPWKQPTILDSVGDAMVVQKNGDEVALRYMSERFLILHFHANWCHACNQLLPKIKTWYTKFQPKLQGTYRSFEVIFISVEEELAEYELSCKDVLWPALSFKEKDRKPHKVLMLDSYPQLLVIDKLTGKIVTVTDEARSGILNEESEETAFPWLSVESSDLNEDTKLLDARYPCIVLWLEKKTYEEQREYINMLNEIAKEHMAVTGYMDFGFLYATKSGNNSERLRAQINQSDSQNPLTLIDFNTKVTYNSDKLSVDEVKSVMRRYNQGSL